MIVALGTQLNTRRRWALSTVLVPFRIDHLDLFFKVQHLDLGLLWC